jgi:hypothetical protein
MENPRSVNRFVFAMLIALAVGVVAAIIAHFL